jgi:hypothetical protein
MVLFSLLISIVFEKHLSADGAHYFVKILEESTFTHIDWTRKFANYLSQLLLVIAVNLDIKELNNLNTIFGISILFQYCLVYFISLFALRGEGKSIILFLLASMITINLSSDYILAGEHHSLALLSWPILFFLLRRSPLEYWDMFFLFGLMFLYTRLYSTAAITSLFFIFIVFLRIRGRSSIPQKKYYFVILFLGIVAVSISLYSILYPRDIENRLSFLQVIFQSLIIPEVIASFIFIILFFIGWFFKRRILLLGAMIPIFLFFVFIGYTDYAITSEQSFGNRSLVVTLLPLLLIMASLIHWKQRKANKTIYAVFVSFVLIMLANNILNTMKWDQFRQQMLSVLQERSGLIRMEDTPMNISPYKWSWNNAELSVILSKGCVKTIVLNAENIGWEPSGPPQSFRLKSYTCYSNEFLSFDASLCQCSK